MVKTTQGEARAHQELLEMVQSGKGKRLREALEEGDPLAFRDERGNTLLHKAISCRAGQSVMRLLIEATDLVDVPNSDGETPLALAAALGNTKTAKVLLAVGAKADAQDNQGRTPLMRAADAGHAGLVCVLIESGANVNAADKNGDTSLMMASSWGDHKVVRVLVRSGAACDFPGKGGWTAMNFAESFGHTEVVKILEKHANGIERQAA